MKKEHLIPNHTQIPNVILDMVIPRLPEAEARVLLYICRRTFGFHKKVDRISVSQFTDGLTDKNGGVLDHGTGLSNRSVQRALESLVGVGAIQKFTGKNGNSYSINLSLDPKKVVDDSRIFLKKRKGGPWKKVNLEDIAQNNDILENGVTQVSRLGVSQVSRLGDAGIKVGVSQVSRQKKGKERERKSFVNRGAIHEQNEKSLEPQERPTTEAKNEATISSVFTEVSVDNVKPFTVNDIISLFQEVFPAEFASEKSPPYAKAPTRKKAEEVLLSIGVGETKRIVEGYRKFSTRQYCPVAGTVFTFLSKIALIKNFVDKEEEKESRAAPYKRLSSPEMVKGEMEEPKYLGAFTHDMKTPLLDAVAMDVMVEYNITQYSFSWVRSMVYFAACSKVKFWWEGDVPLPSMYDVYWRGVHFDMEKFLEQGERFGNENTEAAIWEMKAPDLFALDEHDPTPYVTKGYQFFKSQNNGHTNSSD